MPPQDCLVVFAKEPRLGRVKTRLRDVLTNRQCLGLYKAFLKDTKAMIDRVDCPLKILAYDSFHREPRYLKEIFSKFIFYQQKGKDLGERMHKAFQCAQKLGAEKTVLIGSDVPELPPQYIQEAFIELNKNDFVLGPSEDGGYYLIGLKIPCKNPEIVVDF